VSISASSRAKGSASERETIEICMCISRNIYLNGCVCVCACVYVCMICPDACCVRCVVVSVIQHTTTTHNNQQPTTALKRLIVPIGMFMGGLFFIGSGALVSLLYFSNHLVARGEITSSHLNTFFTHAGLLTLATSGLASNYAEWIRASISAARIDSLIK